MLNFYINFAIIRLPEQVSLAVFKTKTEFCKNGSMENRMENTALMRQYETLASLLIDDRVHMDTTVGFRKLCAWIGADFHDLDNLIREELGVSGEGLLRKLRKEDRRNLERKYGTLWQK